jgi:26S proteasome regulatory subunit N7
MAPFYESFCQEFNLPLDKSILSTMQKANSDELAKMEEKLQDATENLGQTDISDVLIAKANYFTKIGDKVIFWFFLF